MFSINTELERIRNSGLIVSRTAFGKSSTSYDICKPISVSGNTRKNYQMSILIDSGKIRCDAPITTLSFKENVWIFYLGEWPPGPGRGDFELTFPTLKTAVDSILDYYFGDPSRMNSPELVELDDDVE